jgi:hypothetical protein
MVKSINFLPFFSSDEKRNFILFPKTSVPKMGMILYDLLMICFSFSLILGVFEDSYCVFC